MTVAAPGPGDAAPTFAADTVRVNLIARARRLFAPKRRRSGHAFDDPADMGTAFGLDAITTIQPESPAETAARLAAAPLPRMQHRLHRRSTL